MANNKPRDAKEAVLRERGTWNSGARRVVALLFQGSEFFDARDLVQVKYEMVRQVLVEGKSVMKSAAAFGLSRPSFYQALAALEREGLVGLLPRKRGPRGGHKLTAEVLVFLEHARAKTPSLRPTELAARVKERFNVRLHARTVERALRRRGKKRR